MNNLNCNWHLSVPSKAFLAGEYSALLGKPSMLFCFAPRFSLTAKPNKKGATKNTSLFHPESLAGKLEKNHSEALSFWEFEFIDPYNGKGGFGRSSAEFALLYAFLNREHFEVKNVSKLAFRALDQYLSLSSHKVVPPSGADLMAQFCGGIALYSPQDKSLMGFNWPFEELGLLIFSTGVKLSTHTHLESLSKEQLKDFVSQVESELIGIQAALLQKNESLFVKHIIGFSDSLRINNLVCKTTLELLNLLHDKNVVKDANASVAESILVVKGCGALGADMIAVLFDNRKARAGLVAEVVCELAKSKTSLTNLTFVASDKEGQMGLKMEVVNG